MYYLSPPNGVAIRRESKEGSQVWIASFSFTPVEKSLSVSFNEQSIFLINNDSPATVFRLSPNNGSIISTHKYNDINYQVDDIKIFPLSDNSGYSFIGPDLSNFAGICKYNFSSSSAECQMISAVNYGYGNLMITDNTYFMIGCSSSDDILRIYKFTFGNTVVDWSSNINTSTTCLAKESESLLSEDRSTIYLFFILKNNSGFHAYFSSLSVSSGIAGTRYISSEIFSTINGSMLNGDYIVVTIDTCVVIYTISTSSFKFKQFSGNGLFNIAIEPSSGRFIINGQDSDNGYTTKLIIENFDQHSNFTTLNSYFMNIQSLGVDDINTDMTLQNIDPKVSTSVNNEITYNNQSITYSKVSTTTIANYGASSITSWVSIDSNSGTLTINAPTIDADAEYYFYVVSTVSGLNPIKKLIKLKITNCLVQNCKKCSSSNGLTCEVCNNDYTLTSNVCIGGSTTAQSLGKTTISVIGISIGVTSTTNFMDNSSISIIWSMINHVQLLVCLIMLTKSFIPQDVKTVIQGFKFFINVFIYVPISKITFIDSLFSNFDFDLTYRMFNDLGMTSDSSLYNTYPLVGMIFAIIFIHICLRFVLKKLPRIRENGRCACLVKLFKWTINNSYAYMTFGYYIRSFLEIYQFILICSIYEIYLFNTTETFYILSLTFSFVVVIICCIITAFSFCLILISYKIDEGRNNLFQEFFNGIKQSKISRTYTVAFIIRRTMFIIFLICLMSVPSKVVTCILASLQFVFAFYIAILRPFIDLKGNIIEIINEVYIFILLFSLIFLNKDADWNSTNTSIYIWVLSSNSIVVFFIILVNRVIAFTKWIRNRCSKPTANRAQVNQIVVVPKPTLTNLISKLEIDKNTQKMHKSTPNLYQNKIQEESKHDLSINCSILPMIKIDELNQYAI